MDTCKLNNNYDTFPLSVLIEIRENFIIFILNISSYKI